MPLTWNEYLKEKERLAMLQQEAIKQPTPATRLAYYLSAAFPVWRIQSEMIRKLDTAFETDDFSVLYDTTGHSNALIAAIANAMLEEKSAKKLDKEYREIWWARNYVTIDSQS